MDGTFLGDFIPAFSGGLSGTQDILVHPDGSLLVTGINNNTVKQYNGSTGAFIKNFTTGYLLSGPTKMSIGPDSLLYVTQWNSSPNEVARYRLDGSFHSSFTAAGPTRALGMTWDDSARLYVAVFGNTNDGVIRRFDTSGADLGNFIDSQVLLGPTHCWFDHDGTMLVQDWQASNIRRYDALGNYLGIFTSSVGQTEGVAILEDKSMLMPDWAADAVQWVDSAGNYLGVFASGNGLADPNCITKRQALINSLSAKDYLNQIKVRVLNGYRDLIIGSENIDLRKTKIDLFDIKGLDLTKTLREEEISNEHEAFFNIESLSPGVYHVRITLPDDQKIYKILIQ